MSNPAEVPAARRAAAHPDDDHPTDDNTPTAEEAPSPARAATPAADPARTSRLWWMITILTASAVCVASWMWFGDDLTGGDTPDPAAPISVGAAIIVPDNLDPGIPNDELEHLEANTESTFEEGLEPDYVTPDNLDAYRSVDDQGRVLLTVPVEGECGILPSGIIGAPANYRHACHHSSNGAVVYTSHAVRGPRVGALENIQYLQPGQIVTLDGAMYQVGKHELHDAANLPQYLFQPGQVMLLTCHIDSAVDAGAEFTKADVVILDPM